jgi:hypothetical protein
MSSLALKNISPKAKVSAAGLGALLLTIIGLTSLSIIETWIASLPTLSRPQ